MTHDEQRKAERRAIKRAARRAGTGEDAGELAKALRFAGHRAPDSRSSRLRAGIIAALRKGQSNR